MPWSSKWYLKDCILINILRILDKNFPPKFYGAKTMTGQASKKAMQTFHSKYLYYS